MAAAAALGAASAQQGGLLSEAGDPVSTTRAFAAAIAQLYPAGGDYAQAKAGLEAQGFTCEAQGEQSPLADAPTHECTHAANIEGCRHEWAVELRDKDGKMRAPALGSFAVMCVGGVLPVKPRKGYAKPS